MLPGHFTDRESLRALVKPFRLQAWRQENSDKEYRREFKQKFGWCKVVDAGKFFDHKGTDTWYYLIYIDPTKRTRTARNEVVELVTERRKDYEKEFFVRHGHGPLNGEAVWIRSGCQSEFAAEEILSLTVWHEREKSRFVRKTAAEMGVNPKNLVYFG